jgi:adenine-specific DNA methylase
VTELKRRLIEVAFPLKETSLDSVHEKNVRHGHVSTLHIWPARRPLAACRAALIATLLPAPDNAEERRKILERLAGRLEPKKIKKKLPSGKVEEIAGFETLGGILHWGRESGPDLDWFREEIKKAYGGRAPRVLDPFAGGGAIPLEAMRLGCDVTAVDINPVAWFILKCTLEYPQKLAGQKRRLPDFALRDRELMEGFFRAQGLKGALLRTRLEGLGLAEDREPQLTGIAAGDPLLEADLAWHVRAWGRWVLDRARKDLARFYPTYAEFEPLGEYRLGSRKGEKDRGLQFVPLDNDGGADVAALNHEFDEAYLADKRNPRWVAKPTVAYLWARTVACKNCRATIPLLKTRWLCKKDAKRVLLTVEPNADKSGVAFGVQKEVPIVGANAAARREHDKRAGEGIMTRSGAKCPCCGTITEMENIRLEGRAGRLGTVMTAVVMDGQDGKEYRRPTELENQAAKDAERQVPQVFAKIPFGLPTEPLPSKEALGFRVPLYGFDQWYKLFTARQLVALATIALANRSTASALGESQYSQEWIEAIRFYLGSAQDRLADYSSTLCLWAMGEFICHTFTRFALPITWDFVEGNPIGGTSGNFDGAMDWVGRFLDHAGSIRSPGPAPQVLNVSALEYPDAAHRGTFDVIVTDPPYYDAIPYSDLMDFFQVWLRRALFDVSPDFDRAFERETGPKWDAAQNDGELIDDSSRFDGDKERSKANYEDGMFRAFQRCHEALTADGRFVIVFAHKHPDAWETLVSAIIRSGFLVDGSWPIQTERETRMRAYASAALSSSVWLVCRKRPDAARPGWDNRVLEEMHANITQKLREFWDAGIRGPDFVWAATGPALEAYSQHPVVKKANDPGALMTVREFLKHVRRIVVNFVVGRVLFGEGTSEEAPGLDDLTNYYLLHRHDFGMDDAPAGACILYALSCGLSDRELADQYDLLLRTGGKDEPEEEEETNSAEGEVSEGSGSKVKLKGWQQRKGRSLGFESVGGRSPPLIDQVHRLMHLWKTGEVVKVNDYLDARALRQNKIFHRLLQALIELAPQGSEERSLLEKISNHVVARGVSPQDELKL